ncbi:hypothetical protein OE88DRAFT_1656710 [Heliocybe sulcata]|uniref:Uncharacterized protein n=1 Tax=Heliocybe sulcata TaxID=5364 RepID=A0A5C3N6E2_9AGAM|nr:hypothetical protein OE88DRAFT_1656710 [Heliocybe sulcata]
MPANVNPNGAEGSDGLAGSMLLGSSLLMPTILTVDCSDCISSDSESETYEDVHVSPNNRAMRDAQATREAQKTKAYYGPKVTLDPPTGPPLVVKEVIGGTVLEDPARDPRITAILPGLTTFSVSVHPLHLANTRAMWTSTSSTSIIDWRFVRLAGLLPKMVPLRHGVDRVELEPFPGGSGGTTMHVYGRVDVLFDAHGYEFNMPCWVTDISFPLEIILGNDWLRVCGLEILMGGGKMMIPKAAARRTRAVEDVYRME